MPNPRSRRDGMPSGWRLEHAQYVTSVKIYFRPRLTAVASRILKSLMTLYAYPLLQRWRWHQEGRSLSFRTRLIAWGHPAWTACRPGKEPSLLVYSPPSQSRSQSLIGGHRQNLQQYNILELSSLYVRKSIINSTRVKLWIIERSARQAVQARSLKAVQVAAVYRISFYFKQGHFFSRKNFST